MDFAGKGTSLDGNAVTRDHHPAQTGSNLDGNAATRDHHHPAQTAIGAGPLRYADYAGSTVLLDVAIKLSGAVAYEQRLPRVLSAIVTCAGYAIPFSTLGLFLNMLRVGDSVAEETALAMCISVTLVIMTGLSATLNRRACRPRKMALLVEMEERSFKAIKR